MAKKLDSPYTPGRRGERWLKIKNLRLTPWTSSSPLQNMVMVGGKVGSPTTSPQETPLQASF